MAAFCGALVAIHYHRLGLTLSHYDARGHLVVARRIVDSLTPGWQQIGAVWLPLPHLLNAIPVQVDPFYRTGASGVAISITAFALATGSLAWLILAFAHSCLLFLFAYDHPRHASSGDGCLLGLRSDIRCSAGFSHVAGGHGRLDHIRSRF